MEMETDSLPNGNSSSSSTTASAASSAASITTSGSVSAAVPSSKLTHLAESLKLEHQFLRVSALTTALSRKRYPLSSPVSPKPPTPRNYVVMTPLSNLIRWSRDCKDSRGSWKKGVKQRTCKLRDAELDWTIWSCRCRKSIRMEQYPIEENTCGLHLRLQDFIELVRAENNMRAITYARKYLAPWGATHMKELQRVMATLAFRSNTECATYKVLFEAKQWDFLVDQFKQEFCKLYGMTLSRTLKKLREQERQRGILFQIQNCVYVFHHISVHV
ncbi:OLC1v1013319C1 [Oldenlandia corymbosa var. corymbosa]|uniref:OLC1v1013319C1 n=1 Tax=Oldenlandia corymbosa var. corymbosa TaxID=529605 RepID=A0AAV1DYA3_OLDCO|nr:OLC1v1013319C1 [Oldenlandia corymbosa var. corymbosa]